MSKNILKQAKARSARAKKQMSEAQEWIEKHIPVGTLLDIEDERMRAGGFTGEVISHGSWWCGFARFRVRNVSTGSVRQVSLSDVLCIRIEMKGR